MLIYYRITDNKSLSILDEARFYDDERQIYDAR